MIVPKGNNLTEKIMDLTNVKILDETKTTENTNTDVYRWGEKSLLHEAYEGNLEMVKSLVTNGINVIFCFVLMYHQYQIIQSQ